MAYSSIVEMARSFSLQSRVSAAAAQEGVQGNPEQWTQANIWRVVSSPGWAEPWDYAEDTKTVNVNQDTGARNDVINDEMILAAVQAIIAADAPPA
jgi:hypothetical protein